MKKYQNGTIGTWALAALFAFAAACGEDNDIRVTPAPGETPGGDSSNQDGTDDDLTGGDQLTSGDTGGDGTDTGGEEVGSCNDCPTPASGASCCTADADVTAIRAMSVGRCGVDMTEFGFPGCTELDQPGELDAACPPVEFPPGAPPMEGCCTAAGYCGAMETFMGFGCTTNPDSSTWVACGG